MRIAEKSKGREKARAPVQAAGGIVVRDAGGPLIAVVRLRKDNAWVLPKGKLKPGEKALAAAKREVVEETGHEVEVHEFLGAMSREAGKLKIVQFWRMSAVDAPPRRHRVGAGRVAVLPGGCSGFKYGLNIEERPFDDDIVLDASGVRVFVDAFSAQYLSGTTIDYVSSMQGAGFTFSNPNSTGGCGCGSSFTV